QKWGRRRSIVLCCVLGIVLIPLWVFSPGYMLLVIGGFAMQFMVQGAWGIVPVHLNELSPDAVRGTFPGFAYQLGNLFAANTAVVEAQLAYHFRDTSGHPDYAKARPFHAGDFHPFNFPRRRWSRKTRKGILVFAAEGPTASQQARDWQVPPAAVIERRFEETTDKLLSHTAVRRSLRQFCPRVIRDIPSHAPDCPQSGCSGTRIRREPRDSSQAAARESSPCESRRLRNSGCS